MPVLIDQQEVHFEWEDVRKRKPPRHARTEHARTPGVHLSGVLRHVAIQSHMLENRQVDDEDVDVYPLLWVLGLAWEEYCAGFYPEMFWQPDEMVRDGVAGSIDGLTFQFRDDIPALVEEFKFTKKSARREILNDWMFMEQGKGYCNMLRTNGEPGARWCRYHVCHVNGRYEKGRFGRPMYVRSLVEFTDEELRKSWENVVLKYKGETVPEGGAE